MKCVDYDEESSAFAAVSVSRCFFFRSECNIIKKIAESLFQVNRILIQTGFQKLLTGSAKVSLALAEALLVTKPIAHLMGPVPMYICAGRGMDSDRMEKVRQRRSNSVMNRDDSGNEIKTSGTKHGVTSSGTLSVSSLPPHFSTAIERVFCAPKF